MEYVRVMEAFAADQLARRGRSARDYYFGRARVLFRRPCFTGDWYRRTATRHGTPEGEDVLVGAIHPTQGPSQPSVGPPTALVHLFTKKSLPSAGS